MQLLNKLLSSTIKEDVLLAIHILKEKKDSEISKTLLSDFGSKVEKSESIYYSLLYISKISINWPVSRHCFQTNSGSWICLCCDDLMFSKTIPEFVDADTWVIIHYEKN